jgi:hypothetical protein
MPGPPVTIGCAVLLSPGLSGPPDNGTIIMVTPGGPTAAGQPLAFEGSLCLMINSVWGFPYPMPIGAGSTSQARASGQALLRVGDAIPSGPGVMTIVGPPAAPYVVDNTG